jgi:hypothetical protein
VCPVEDLAIARVDPVGEQAEGIDLGERPAFGCARFEFNGGRGRVVNVTAAFSDERAQRLIAGELHHFSRQYPNVLVIHVGAIGGGLTAWVPLVRRCFQPARNTRLGAVLLLERHFDGPVVPGAHRGQLLENPHAVRPSLVD